MTKSIRRKMMFNIQVITMLKQMAEHYRLTENSLIEMLFIMAIDLDYKNVITKNNTNENFNPDITTREHLYIRVSDDKYKEMKCVAKSYNLNLLQYIELLITSSFNKKYHTNNLIEAVFI